MWYDQDKDQLSIKTESDIKSGTRVYVFKNDYVNNNPKAPAYRLLIKNINDSDFGPPYAPKKEVEDDIPF
jgi:hypothetical protein